MRSFLAAKIPDNIKNKIGDFIEELKHGKDNVKWVNPENIHITIYFFGELNEEDYLTLSKELPLMGDISLPFEVSIKTISAFPDPKRPRVIWCGVEDRSNILKKANDFVKDIVKNNNLNVEIEKREYSPHLTIGRVKGRYSNLLVKKIISAESREFGSFTIDELILFRSTLTRSGPIYEIIERFPFKGTI